MSKVPIAPIEEQLDAALEQKTPKRSENVDYALKFLAAAIGGAFFSDQSSHVRPLMDIGICIV